jgi:ABC-type ATPase with predicted acetyltransferase domain
MGSHVADVVRWFGLREGRESRGCSSPNEAPHVHAGLSGVALPRGGEIVLVTGASGGGKSTLLREMMGEARAGRWEVVELARVRVPRDVAVVDVPGLGLDESLRLLSAVGLGEAHSYVQRAGELSEGQRWRLRLAAGLARVRGREAVVFADEFAAVLDRVTAMGVAHSLRRVTGWEEFSRVGFVVATSHSDLVRALGPDRVVRCDFGRMTNE